jgi:hypothetical protein
MSTITYCRDEICGKRAISSTDPIEQMFIDACDAVIGIGVSLCNPPSFRLQINGLSNKTAIALLDLLREEGFDVGIGEGSVGWGVYLNQ